VLCDSTTTPTRGIRFGGPSDDRILGIETDVLGKVNLSGASASRDWLNGLDPFSTGLDGQDGFALSMQFSQVNIVNSGTFYLGRDLQRDVQVRVASEPGADGILLVRSSDSSKLLVSTGWLAPGTDQLLFRSADQYQEGISFNLQALADSGQVDIIVEGRSAI